MLDASSEPLSVVSRGVVRRLLAIFVPASVVLAGVVAVLYYKGRSDETLLFQHDGAHIVDLQTEIISREFKSIESDLLYLSEQERLREFLSGGAATRQKLEQEYLLFCRNKGLYDQIRYLDETGTETIRINYRDGQPVVVDESELQPKATATHVGWTLDKEASRG